ncbi:MAG: acid phosphatase [Legionella sp.]|nr:MAG: acid phosphatase [Legionella sp.]
MNTKNIVLHTLFAIVAAFVIQAKTYAEPANLGLLKKNLVEYYDSGAYLKEVADVANTASQYIETEVRANQNNPVPKKLAIVLDIDETCLSNFTNMKSIDFANLPDEITRQLLAADEPAIQPMHELYLKALQQNVAVFFVTGRDKSLEKATIQNLHAAGYQSWSGLELRGEHIPTIAYKTAARTKITQQGYTIIASIGDQNSDLVGGYAQQTFKLPNPFYFLP